MGDQQKKGKRPDRRPCRQGQTYRSAMNKARRIIRNHNHGRWPEGLATTNYMRVLTAAKDYAPTAGGL